MIRHIFYIRQDRLSEFKTFICANLKSAIFVKIPYTTNSGKGICCCIDMDSKDYNILQTLFNKWYDIDHPPKKTVLERIRLSLNL